MEEGKEINTTSSSTIVEDDQIGVDIQSPPPMPQDINIPSPLDDEILMAPNSPTNVEDFPSEDEDLELEDDMMEEEGMEDYVEEDGLALDSKIKALEERLENLTVENTLLKYDSLYRQITNRMLEAQVARERVVHAGLLMQSRDQDEQLRVIREILEGLEKSLANFPGTSKKPRDP